VCARFADLIPDLQQALCRVEKVLGKVKRDVSGVLAPALHFRPELGESAEFRTLAKEDVDLFFQSVGVVSGCAHVLHLFPEAFENLSAVVKDDHAVAGVATRAPEEPGLVAAEGRREPSRRPKKSMAPAWP
jgi:hypothetical protein